MAKLRLVVWVVGLGAAATVLLRGVTWSEEPDVAVMGVVRCVAGVLAAYLCVATLAAVGRVRLPAPTIVRRLVAGAIGAGLLVAPMTASAAPSERAPVEAPVLRRAPAAAPVPIPEGQQPRGGGVDAERGPGTVTVAAGDHLWAIAERVVAGRLGRSATDGEVAPYWAALVEANRDRLATADPDLVFPGQVFRLPS